MSLQDTIFKSINKNDLVKIHFTKFYILKDMFNASFYYLRAPIFKFLVYEII